MRNVAAGAVVVWVLTTAAALAQLFLGRTVGLADNGDAARLVCRLGLVIGPGTSQQNWVGVYYPAPVCPAGGEFDYRTSWRSVVRATVAVEQWLTGDESFDVRALGVVCSVLLGVGAAALFLALPGRLGRRLGLTVLMVVAACDIGFVTYFNSGYSDAAGFIGLIFVCAGVVGVVVHRSWPWLVVLAGSVIFVGTAKTQLLTIVVAVALALLLARRRWAGRPRTSGSQVPRLGLVLPVLLVGLLAVTGLAARGQGESFSQGNKVNLLFYTILADSPDPVADLAEMGLPVSLAQYAGMNAWETDSPWNAPDVVAAEPRLYSSATYVEFLLRHPDRLTQMVQRSADAVLDARVDYLSNSPGETFGEPRLAERPSPVFWLFDQLPRGWPVPVLVLVWLGGVGLGARWSRSPDVGRAARGVLLVTTGLFAASQAVLALADGYYELAKHDVHAAFATGLLLAVLLETGLGAVVSAVQRRDGPPAAVGRGATDRDPGGGVVQDDPVHIPTPRSGDRGTADAESLGARAPVQRPPG